MPELGISRSSLRDRIQADSDIRKGEGANFQTLRGHAAALGISDLGKGAECIVFPHPTRPDRVVALSYEEQRREVALIKFYMHRVYSILFPRNFPRIYAYSWPDPSVASYSVTGSVRERIQGSFPTDSGTGTYIYTANSAGDQARFIIRRMIHPQSPDPIWKIHQVCTDQDIPLALDSNVQNFLLTGEGEEFYVDSLFATYIRLYTSMQALGWHPVFDRYEEFMMSRSYSPQDIQTVRDSLMRILIITNERSQVPIEEYVDIDDL